VFLYGDSGTGKSSLVNAGLLPQARALGFEPVRVRVQPRAGEELVIEAIAVSDDESSILPCALAPEADGSARVVLSIAEFEARVRAASAEVQPLIVFDQFEEILTLFEDDRESRLAIAQMVVRLLREALPVKLLFAFREDHLGRVKQLLGARPELVDQALRLGPPPADTLTTIIRGPFDRHPGHFAAELDPALAMRLQVALAERFGSGEVSLSEVQTVCLRLWQSPDPAALLAEKGVQGLLEDELGEALDALAPALRAAAIAVLSQMVTPGGTRNVVSAEDLRHRVHDADEGIAPELVDEALDRLERESKLVRRERRRDIYLYEITSEFLVPWISRRRDELRLAQERRRGRRRLRIVAAIAAALVLMAVGVAAVVLGQRADTQRQLTSATSLALAAASAEPWTSRPDVSLALAFEAYRTQARPEASTAVYQALTAARGSRLRGVLDTGIASGMAFSADGKILATGGPGSAVRLWDPVMRRKLGSLAGKGAEVSVVAISPDGRTVAAAADDGGLHRWDLVSRRRLGGSSVQEGGIDAIAFSPDAKTIATTGNQDGTVRLWDAVSGRHVGRLDVRGDSVKAVAFSPDGKLVVTAGQDDEVQLWDATSRERVGGLGAHSRAGLAVAFSPDGKTLATTSQDDTAVRLWDVGSRAQVGLFEVRSLSTAVAFSPDGSTIATVGDEDGAIVLWDAASHKQRARLTGHNDVVIAIAFHADGRTFASAADDGSVRLWDLSDRARPGSGAGRSTPVHAVAFTPDGSTLVAAGEDGGFASLDPVDHEPVGRIAGDRDTVLDATFSADRKIAATANIVGTVTVSDLAGGRRVGVLRSGQQFFAVALSPDGATLATGGETFSSSEKNANVALWDPVRRTLVGRLRGRGGAVAAVAFSPDGKLLVTATADTTVHLWDPVRRREVGRLPGGAGGVDVMAFSPDGHTLATGGDAVRLWDLAARKEVGRLDGVIGSVAAIAFSPDGRTLATSSYDENPVRLWDVATRRQRASLGGHTSPVYGLAFSPDGGTLASAGADKTVRLWTDVFWHDEAELHDVVCDVLLPGLTRSEWNRYAPGIAYRRSCP
jgi:WD40 repeat protein